MKSENRYSISYKTEFMNKMHFESAEQPQLEGVSYVYCSNNTRFIGTIGYKSPREQKLTK